MSQKKTLKMRGACAGVADVDGLLERGHEAAGQDGEVPVDHVVVQERVRLGAGRPHVWTRGVGAEFHLQKKTCEKNMFQ